MKQLVKLQIRQQISRHPRGIKTQGQKNEQDSHSRKMWKSYIGLRNDSRPSWLVGTCYVENQTWKQSGHEGKEQVKFLFFYQSMLCLSTAFYPACNQSFSVKIFSHVMKKNYSALSFWSFPASVPPQPSSWHDIFEFSPSRHCNESNQIRVSSSQGSTA